MTALYGLTPMHQWHREHGARFTEEAGWKRTESYGDPDQETASVSTAVGICDTSSLTKIDVQGTASDSFLRRYLALPLPRPGLCLSSSSSAVSVGGALLHVSRLTSHRFLLLTEPGSRRVLSQRLSDAASASGCVHVTDLTSAYAAIHLVGPKSLDLLKKLCPADLAPRSFPSSRCVQAPVAKVGGLLIREDIAGLLAYYLLVSRDYGEYVWKCVMAAGQEYGIRPFGLTAEQRLERKEAKDVAAI